MSEGMGLGASNLQSGFVVAVLIAAVLLAQRLGGDEALSRRVVQVAIGVALTLLVFSGTTAFLRQPEAPEGSLLSTDITSERQAEKFADELSDFAKDSAQRASEVGSVHLGIGLMLVIIGAALQRSLRVIPTGVLLGGVLLLILGASPAGGLGDLFGSFSTLFGSVFPGGAGDAGQARDIVRFVVLAVGTLLLLEFVFWQWESGPTRAQGTGGSTDSPPETTEQPMV